MDGFHKYFTFKISVEVISSNSMEGITKELIRKKIEEAIPRKKIEDDLTITLKVDEPPPPEPIQEALDRIHDTLVHISSRMPSE